ncbi:hypothetical protein HRG_013741 [Hirsutella rhossiliensis]
MRCPTTRNSIHQGASSCREIVPLIQVDTSMNAASETTKFIVKSAFTGRKTTKKEYQLVSNSSLLTTHGALADALDELLDVEGLRSAFLLKTMHKVIALQCREVFIRAPEPKAGEILSYFAWIKHCFFETITQGDIDALQSLDEFTVRALEQKCPRYGAEDRKEIENLLTSGKIFATKTPDWRQELLLRLCNMELLIPSLFTFHNDVKVLEYCAHCMRHLIDVPRKNGSITTELRASFKRDLTQFKDARVNMWLYARKRHLEMPLAPRRNDKELLAKIRPRVAKREDLIHFANYAAELGFWSAKIRHWTAGQASHVVQELSSDRLEESVKRPLHRCGFPDTASFKFDKAHLNLERLNKAGPELDTFHVLRSVLYAFFIHTGATPEALSIWESRVKGEKAAKKSPKIAVVCGQRWWSSISLWMMVRGKRIRLDAFSWRRRLRKGVEFITPTSCLESALRSGIGVIFVKPMTSSGITDDLTWHGPSETELYLCILQGAKPSMRQIFSPAPGGEVVNRSQV